MYVAMETELPDYTPQAAARALSVSVDTLKRWEAAGRLTAYRTEGGHRRFPRTEVQRLIDLRGIAS